MARRIEQNPTAATLEDLESLGDRLGSWVAANPLPVLGTLGLVLAVAAGVGFSRHVSQNRAEEAAWALEQIRGEFRTAMGASPMAAEIPEPANPETARAVREEYAAKFQAVADEHDGQPASALARLELGSIQAALGDPEAAIATWRAAAEGADADAPARALLLQRVAGQYEDLGRWREAGEAYEVAGDVAGYPLRYEALAQAAWVWLEAGDRERGLALWNRIQAEAPDTQLAPHVSARLREAALAPAPPVPPES